MVKVLILCAGYGTRLQRGIKEDTSGKYNHLLGVSKPLVPLGGTPLISHWIKQLEGSGKVSASDVYLVVNNHFYPQFTAWAEKEGFPLSNVVNDGTLSNETRLGAVKDMELIVSHFSINEPLVVIAGDTLFNSDFSFDDTLRKFEEYGNSSLVLHYHEDATEKTGILELDSEGKVVNFLEKPSREETNSRKACPCFYILHPDSLTLLHEYVASATCLNDVDAAGQFIRWLYSRHPIISQEISGRFDIGALDSYIYADEYFHKVSK